MAYIALPQRYDDVEYRRAGRSGVLLPLISLGLFHNFGDDRDFNQQEQILCCAFDRGITHFDLANNYGPPYGAAEATFGRAMTSSLRPHRDELFVASKAGFDMWPGPHGNWGSRKYLVASIDQSLKRTGLEYFDAFYSHRPDPDTPIEETMGALDYIVKSGRALYVGISSYSADQTRSAAAELDALGTPLLLHQARYSLLDRWIEPELLEAVADVGAGCVAFSTLAEGTLTAKYLEGVPIGSRLSRIPALSTRLLTDNRMHHIRALHELALRRGQPLAQMALAWALRDPRVTSVVVGASSVAQLDENLAALDNRVFDAAELDEIDALSERYRDSTP